MSDLQQDYVRALRFRWLTSIYDPVVYWTTREATFKQQLVAQAVRSCGFSGQAASFTLRIGDHPMGPPCVRLSSSSSFSMVSRPHKTACGACFQR